MSEGVSERTALLQSRPSSVGSVGVDPTNWKPTNKLRFIQAVTWINVFLTGFDSTVAASIYTTIASEFGAANNAVWVSTSYLITSVSFQALYGRLSDIFGRRIAFLFGTIIFTIGTFLCSISKTMLFLNLSRAIAGLGGGGLMTMATVVLSDNVPFQRRGLYQAANNVWFGVGSALGASLGGVIAQAIGWRYVFLLQVPISLTAVLGGFFLIKDPEVMPLPRGASVDVLGATSLVLAVSSLLLALSMGGNEIDWSSSSSIGLVSSALAFFALFFWIESRAEAPILPSRMLIGSRLAFSNIMTNFFSGMSIYVFLFMVPLYFLGVFLEPTSIVGKRLMLPALGFPLGAIIAGITMSKYGQLNLLVRMGCIVLLVGSLLPLLFSLDHKQSEATYFFSLIPVQIGQGLINPSSLFTMLAAFSHAGTCKGKKGSLFPDSHELIMSWTPALTRYSLDQAVATSTVYLCRSLGNVAGVAIGSAALQNYLRIRLPTVLKDVPNADKVSVTQLHVTVCVKKKGKENSSHSARNWTGH